MTPEHDALARQLIALSAWTATGPLISQQCCSRWRAPGGLLWRRGLRPRGGTWLPCLADDATGGVIAGMLAGSNIQESGAGGWEANGKRGDTFAEAACRAFLQMHGEGP